MARNETVRRQKHEAKTCPKCGGAEWWTNPTIPHDKCVSCEPPAAAKTIAGETFTPPPPASKTYTLREPEAVAPAPVASTRTVVTQQELSELVDTEEQIEMLTAWVKKEKERITKALRDGCGVEAGPLSATTKPNYKRNSVDWRAEFVGAVGEEEAAALEAARKAEGREVSSYSLIIGGAE